MPELAEVEFFRKQWDAGLGQKVGSVALHAKSRIFRGTDTARLKEVLEGARLLASEAHGKRMLFRFSRGGWLGIHLGMSGRLRIEQRSFTPAAHDHLALFQRRQTLVLTDPRMFGRVRFHCGNEAPAWWRDSPPVVSSKEFTVERVYEFVHRRARLPIKAALLVQVMFPGVGNWMADEILWRARIDPRHLCGSLARPQVKALWRATRTVCHDALASVGEGASDPPRSWLFHQRWKPDGHCPRDGRPLATAEIGGRTTRWCRRCQR